MSLDEREREYSPSSCIGGEYAPFIDDYRRLSAMARAAHAPASYRYGAKATQTLDLFLPANTSGKPALLVFIHGGYWQELSKEDSAFAAPCCLANGTAFAAINYTLAPNATLDEIVCECVDAIDWLMNFASVVGIDPNRVFVSGSSAGAHLAAMAALKRRSIRGAVLVSGIYDLSPLAGTSIAQPISLSSETIGENSPLLNEITSFPPSLIAWGEIETNQAKRQSQAFAAHLAAAGTRCRSLEVPKRNHFDVILDLADPGTALGAKVHSLIHKGTI
jgi:arylformamidase